jgi:hypothetical protein
MRPSRTRQWAKGCKRGKLEKLSRYETHLDRKFERTLGMLVKLKAAHPRRAPWPRFAPPKANL